MKLDIFKNSWSIYKSNFGKLFSFSISIAIISLISYIAVLLLGGFDFYLTGILLVSFVLNPLFYSFQVATLKVSSGMDIDYNEFYANYKAYYRRNTFGAYSIIKSVLFAVLMSMLMVFLCLVLHDIIFPDMMENAIASLNGLVDSPDYINEVINTALNVDYFIPMLIVFLGFGHSFFFVSLKNKLMVPLFASISPIPLMMTNNVYNTIYKKNKKEINSHMRLANLLFFIAFLIGFILFGLIANLFQDQLVYIEYILIIAYVGGMLLSSVFTPVILIGYCFIADGLHNDYMVEMTKALIKFGESIKDDNSEDLNDIKENINNIVSSLNKDMEDKEKSPSDEEDSN